MRCCQSYFDFQHCHVKNPTLWGTPNNRPSKCRLTEKERGCSIHLFTAQMAAMARVDWLEIRGQELLPGLPHWCRFPRTWVILSWFLMLYAESWLRNGAARIRLVALMGCQHTARWIISMESTLHWTPNSLFFNKMSQSAFIFYFCVWQVFYSEFSFFMSIIG